MPEVWWICEILEDVMNFGVGHQLCWKATSAASLFGRMRQSHGAGPEEAVPRSKYRWLAMRSVAEVSTSRWRTAGASHCGLRRWLASALLITQCGRSD